MTPSPRKRTGRAQRKGESEKPPLEYEIDGGSNCGNLWLEDVMKTLVLQKVTPVLVYTVFSATSLATFPEPMHSYFRWALRLFRLRRPSASIRDEVARFRVVCL